MHPTQNNENNSDEGHLENREQQEVHSQTDSSINAQHQVSQTEKIASQDSNVQTKNVDIQHSSMQTTPKDEKQSAQQTDTLQVIDTESQTVYAVRVVEPTVDVESQAGTWCPVDGLSQTDQSWSLMVESVSQTELEQAEVLCQTEPTITSDQNVQAQAEQSEGGCQTVKDEQHVLCQTETNEAEAIIQTDSSMANLVEGEVQAVAEVMFQACQASVDCYVGEAQTDSSMALQSEQEVQATVVGTEQYMQTDVTEIQETFVQTELDTDHKCSQTEVNSEERDSQTEIYVVESECQTEIEAALPIVSSVQQDALPIVNNTPQVVFQETVEGNQMENNLEIPDLTLGIDSSQQSDNSAGASQVLQIVPEFSEEGCQTDPVTIIIGDASFLVKKLKSSSLSPTKVSSMGNEIEIELRADEEETPYDLPEKEHTVAPLPTPTRARGNPSPYRARGVRTRGGAVQRANYRGGNPHYGQRQQMTYSSQVQSGGQYYASSAGVLGKYSCPVCSETFHESPALYEHLQRKHAEAFNLIKKPKGREGKTIQQKVYQEPEPPVLTPVEPIGVEQPQQIEVYESTSEIVQEVPQPEVGLFEDPSTWQSPNKSRKRTLARRQITDEETTEMPEAANADEMHIVIQPTEETVVQEETTAKRKADEMVEQDTTKRSKTAQEAAQEPEPQVPELQAETMTEVTEEEGETPRRRSRASLRTIKQEKLVEATPPPPTDDVVKTPRSRGRPRKTDK